MRIQYLLVRPAPPFRILFTSPSLRIPGILQSSLLCRIGGSSATRTSLEAALANGTGVSAKMCWLSRPDANGEGNGSLRWLHCTPLLHHSGAVGLWMIVLVDEEGSAVTRCRQAPSIARNIGVVENEMYRQRTLVSKREERTLRIRRYENQEFVPSKGGTSV